MDRNICVGNSGCDHINMSMRLRSHKHEYESGTVWVPIYEFWQTQVCMYFTGGRTHRYEYGYL